MAGGLGKPDLQALRPIYGVPRLQARRSPKKLNGPAQWPVPPIACLAFGNNGPLSI